MTEWLLTIEAASEDVAGDVDLERVAMLPSQLQKYEASASGGGLRYGVVLKSSLAKPDEALHEGLDSFMSARVALGLPTWPVVRCDALTTAEFVRRVQLSRPPELVGINEVASHLLREGVWESEILLGTHEASRMLDVSRQRFFQLLEREDFPRPVVQLAATPVWLASSIEAYSRRRRRTPGRPPASWRNEDAVEQSLASAHAEAGLRQVIPSSNQHVSHGDARQDDERDQTSPARAGA